MKRRELVAGGIKAGLALAAAGSLGGRARAEAGGVAMRKLGKTGALVSALGVGGYHLGVATSAAVAKRIVHEAIDSGLNFFDNAWEYNEGESEKRLGAAIADRRDKIFLMTKVCTHGRGKEVAMQQLHESLRRLQTDHLDLWQVHECVYFNDPERHFAPGGVIEALELAKKQGKVRFVGFTGHKDPEIHLAMLAKGYAFDTVQMPLNAFDGQFRSFELKVLPEVNARGLGALGMKSLGGSGQPVRAGIVTVEEALRYAMSLPVATTISGIDSVEVLRQNLRIARMPPMDDAERKALRDRLAPEAAEGRWELYKTTTRYDADEGRKQHGYPPRSEMPL